MPRKGSRPPSPEVKAKNDAAIAAWHAKNVENLSIGLRKGKRDAYKRLAEKLGTSVSALVQTHLDALCRENGIDLP